MVRRCRSWFPDGPVFAQCSFNEDVSVIGVVWLLLLRQQSLKKALGCGKSEVTRIDADNAS